METLSVENIHSNPGCEKPGLPFLQAGLTTLEMVHKGTEERESATYFSLFHYKIRGDPASVVS